MKQIRWGDVVTRVAASCPELAREMPTFGFDLQAALNSGGPATIPAIAYRLMFDENGQPPTDLSEEQFMAILPGNLDTMIDLLGASLAAITNAAVDKQTMTRLVTSAVDAQSHDLSELLKLILKSSRKKKETWCDEKGWSKSLVSEFLKDGSKSRVASNTQQAIELAILEDARSLQLI